MANFIDEAIVAEVDSDEESENEMQLDENDEGKLHLFKK